MAKDEARGKLELLVPRMNKLVSALNYVFSNCSHYNNECQHQKQHIKPILVNPWLASSDGEKRKQEDLGNR